MKLDDYKSVRVANGFLQSYMALLKRRGHGAEELHGVVDMLASELHRFIDEEMKPVTAPMRDIDQRQIDMFSSWHGVK